MSEAQKQDRVAAKEAAYASPVNPFPEGTRRHRYFVKARQHYENMEAAFRDLEQVYGPIGGRIRT
jgi:hypothetical protein